jgi:hypothetical protein
VGTLDKVVKKLVDGQKIIYFTLLCKRESEDVFDKVECKVHGIQADAFERICLPGSELTVLGRLATKESEDGAIKTGVCAAQIFERDLFDVSDEPDSCRLRRIARMYDEDEDYVEWSDEMLEEWDHANREERAFLRGKYGTPPGRKSK